MPSKLFWKSDREIENIITALSAHKKVKYNKDIFNFASFYVPYHSVKVSIFTTTIYQQISCFCLLRDGEIVTHAQRQSWDVKSTLHGVATATAILLI